MGVPSDGYHFDGRFVCGIAVCSICNSELGNEDKYYCAEHTSLELEKENQHHNIAEPIRKVNQQFKVVNNLLLQRTTV